ncbi:hypothetical protein BJY01DRAFT_255383 [Aspergillus pseudoustus]|uniref:Uncharacterized protein n=1 Tax=Aspergillus pseudoustus TaxID=1810923 RepID=A0ABR4INL3_9EURO
MKIFLFSVIYFLSVIFGAEAVNIIGFPRAQCSGSTVGRCINIAHNVCCVFPYGGIIATAAFFSLLHECTVGIWYYETDSRVCGIARETASGLLSYICITGGRAVAGGGAAWFDLSLCRTAGSRTAASEEELAGLLEGPSNCTSQQIATHYALSEDGKGAYVLTPTQEQLEELNTLPVAGTRAEEIEIMKRYNATYYDDVSLVPDIEDLDGLLVPDDY